MKKTELLSDLKENIRGKKIKIVFPESQDTRILSAAVRLHRENLVEPILIGKKEEIEHQANDLGFQTRNIQVIDPETYPKKERMKKTFLERRKGKVTEQEAETLLEDVHYFSTMLVYMDEADGLVSGAQTSTGETVRPALQIIKTRPGISRASGAFIMMRDRGEKFIFADCAINVNPSAHELAEIAVESAKTAQMFHIEPKVAMLSFSTKGSASSEEAAKVAEATKMAQEMAPDLAIDGELQFDAAFDQEVAKKKVGDSKVAGKATVFVFPELQSGNIGYKIAERLGGFESVGPILQGMNKPVSDLSRGCNGEDVYKTTIITANQAILRNRAIETKK